MEIGGKIIGILGCGNMGSAILNGVLGKKIVSSHNIIFFDTDQRKVARLRRQYPIMAVNSVDELFFKSDIVILAIKPQTLPKIKVTIPDEEMQKKLIVSILAGTPVSKLRSHFGTNMIVRVMPNLGAMLGEGISAVAKSRVVPAIRVRWVKCIFSSCGEVVELPETLFDAVTGISGTGPAYYFYITELLTKAAIKYGIPKNISSKLAIKTAHAAALMMAAGAQDPAILRKMVTSKGGTTEAALKTFVEKKLDVIFTAGITAAIKRGQSLAKES